MPDEVVLGGGGFAMMILLNFLLLNTIILTNDLTNKQPIEVFNCREKIYVYMILEALPKGEHEIKAHWYNPQGKRQENTVHNFKTPANDAWLWLKLHPAFGGKLFGGLDPSAGMSDYIGRWKVVILLDNKEFSRQVFYVVC